jgi:uncharacterized phage protein (TIGR02218 family)
MKAASTELLALLNGQTQFNMADLLTVTLKSGTVLRYTSADIPLEFGGQTFVPFRFKRGKTRVVIGVEVDTLDLTLYVGIDDLMAGVPYPRFAQNGGFDGALVKLEKAFLTDWADPIVGALWMFSGRVSELTPTRTEIKLGVKSDLELLNIQMPRNLYQPRCGFTLYDQGCGVSKAAFKETATVSSQSTRTYILCSLVNPAGWFASGLVSFLTGPNAGVTRTIKSYTSGVIEIALPLPVAPNVGDTLEVWPGCDKTQGTCTAKFNNKARFRGFPYVPVPETAY